MLFASVLWRCAMLCRLQQSCISGEHHSILGDREKCRGTFKDDQSNDPRKSHNESFGRVSEYASQYVSCKTIQCFFEMCIILTGVFLQVYRVQFVHAHLILACVSWNIETT